MEEEDSLGEGIGILFWTGVGSAVGIAMLIFAHALQTRLIGAAVLAVSIFMFVRMADFVHKYPRRARADDVIEKYFKPADKE